MPKKSKVESVFFGLFKALEERRKFYYDRGAFGLANCYQNAEDQLLAKGYIGLLDLAEDRIKFYSSEPSNINMEEIEANIRKTSEWGLIYAWAAIMLDNL